MCYILAKRFDKPGSIAYKTERGKHCAELVSTLALCVAKYGVQIVTITDLDVFGEYKPYTMVNTEEEFVRRANKLAELDI